MGISTIVFDFGNVLGLFSHRLAAEQLSAFTDLSAEHVYRVVFGGFLEEDYESGRITTEAFLATLRRELRLTGEDRHVGRAFADIFAPNLEVCGVLPYLRGKYRLVLLSNTNDLHFRHFSAQFASILEAFDLVVASHQVGVRKPDPRIYRLVEERTRARPAECLFIDDLPANVEAARACGWQGVVYRPSCNLLGLLREAGVAVSSPLIPVRQA